MKKLIMILFGISLAICMTGCKKTEPPPPSQEMDNDDIPIMYNNENYLYWGAGKYRVRRNNPVFQRYAPLPTYLYSMPGYDIMFFEFAIESAHKGWNTLPITQITDKIYSLYQGKERPIIRINSCELFYNTNMLEFSFKCSIGFELIASDTPNQYFVYEEGYLYKVKRISNSDQSPKKELWPKYIADIPQTDQPDFPIPIEKEFFYYTLFVPQNTLEFETLSIQQAANELFESALLAEIKPSQLEHLYILYDGIATFNDKKAYEFTILNNFHDIFSNVYKSHEYNDRYECSKDMCPMATKGIFRMGVTEDHQYYTYKLEPVDTNRTAHAPLKKEERRTYYQNYYFFRYYFNDKRLRFITPAPRYRVNSAIIPETAALGLGDLLDNALLHNKTLFDPQKIQNLEMDGQKVSIYANLFPYKPDFYDVIWTGVDTIQNEEALEFALIMFHDIETDFDYNIIRFAVTQSGKLFTYAIQPTLGGSLTFNDTPPMTYKEFRRFYKSNTKAPFMIFSDKDCRIISKQLSIHFDVQILPMMTPIESAGYIDQLIDKYQKPLIPASWRKKLYKVGKINGENTYEYEVGQEAGPSLVYLLFNAAVSETGKVYIYENDSPKLVTDISLK